MKGSAGGRDLRRVDGDVRRPVRGDRREIIEMRHGITVYPPAADGLPWRAVFTENGRQRYRQAVTEAGLAAKLAKVTERLAAEADNMERPGADLIASFEGASGLANVHVPGDAGSGVPGGSHYEPCCTESTGGSQDWPPSGIRRRHPTQAGGRV